jgi:hypothetical protein
MNKYKFYLQTEVSYLVPWGIKRDDGESINSLSIQYNLPWSIKSSLSKEFHLMMEFYE